MKTYYAYEIALREGTYLVFPSQSTRENPNLPDPEGKTITFKFEGSVVSIYTTLAVRLAHSGIFRKKDLWKNAITYETRLRGICGMFLHNYGEGYGELTLFFNKDASKEMRTHFEEYVRMHLERRTLLGSLETRRFFICHNCDTSFTDVQIKRRRELGFENIHCSVCDTEVSLFDKENPVAQVRSPFVQAMDRTADANRERDAAKAIVQGKLKTDDFDVFLCYNSKDKSQVQGVGELLKERGILPWLDIWEARPGTPWQQLLEQQIGKIKAVAVFVGKEGIGPWQQQELYTFLNEFTRRGCPVIPVLLENASGEPSLPIFLRGMTWVDFDNNDSDPLSLLIWGITGRRT